MALVELAEIWDGRSTGFTKDFRRGSWIQERRHIRKFLAITNNQLDDSMTVFLSALVGALPYGPLPALWSSHPNDPLARLTHHEMTQESASPNYWTIACNYETVPDPLDELAILEWSNGSVEFVLEGAQAFVDSSGVEILPTTSPYPNAGVNGLYPITNSALDPFDPPPTEPEYYRILKVTKNFDFVNCTGTGSNTGASNGTGSDVEIHPNWGFEPQVIDENFTRRTNAVPFTVPDVCNDLPRDTVFLAEPPTARQEFRNNREFWVTTWTFWIRLTRGWNLKLADLGYRSNAIPTVPGYLSGEQPIPIYRGGQPVQNPAKLDGNGDEAAIGAPAVFLNYRIYKRANFNLLNLFEGMV